MSEGWSKMSHSVPCHWPGKEGFLSLALWQPMKASASENSRALKVGLLFIFYVFIKILSRFGKTVDNEPPLLPN